MHFASIFIKNWTLGQFDVPRLFCTARVKFPINSAGSLRLIKFPLSISIMNDTAHLLSTKANKKRLLESIAQDKKTSQALEKQSKKELKMAGKKRL